MGLCGSGGRHLPQLHNNPNVELAAIVQRSEQPTAAAYLHTELESKTQLQERCEGMSKGLGLGLGLVLGLGLGAQLQERYERVPTNRAPIKARSEWRRKGCTSAGGCARPP